ncbi:hypothetical protein [Marinobacter alkaliphilus]|uniref:Uncharacterized protein n=2 Tax=Marinobacter TaxID=2742 RepID=A0A455WBR6_MARNT|nr:hypothetical protein YBY_22560 [Marinobacter nauticus]
MDNTEFIADQFAKELLKSNIESYRDMLARTDPSKAVRVYAEAVLAMRKLSGEDQDAIISFLRVVASDTASQIFGVIGGSSDLEGVLEDFSLYYGREEISENLQDEFLAASEQIIDLKPNN